MLADRVRYHQSGMQRLTVRQHAEAVTMIITSDEEEPHLSAVLPLAPHHVSIVLFLAAAARPRAKCLNERSPQEDQ